MYNFLFRLVSGYETQKIFYCLDTVSYTHLDVYKRQPFTDGVDVVPSVRCPAALRPWNRWQTCTDWMDDCSQLGTAQSGVQALTRGWSCNGVVYEAQ